MKFRFLRLPSLLWLCAGAAAGGCGSSTEAEPTDSCESGVCLCVVDLDCPDGLLCESFTCVSPSVDGDTGPDVGVDMAPDSSADVPADGPPEDPFVPGACTGDSDFELMLSEEASVEACEQACASSPDPQACSVSCLEALGISSECAACRGDWVVCVADACPVCLDGVDEECFECVTGATACNTDYDSCAGIREDIEPPEPPVEAGCSEDEQAEFGAQRSWYQAGVDCVLECDGQEPLCLEDCMARSLATSVACALCFVEQQSCAELQCQEACTDPESNDCADCRNGACIEDLEECVGIDLYEEPQQAFSRLRLAHLSPETPSVTGFMQDSASEFAVGIQFGAASDSTLRIPVFGTTLEVRPASEGLAGAVLFEVSAEFPFGPNEVSTVAIYGSGEAAGVWLVSQDLGERPAGASMQLYNGASSVGAIDVYQFNGSERVEFVQDLAYGEGTMPIEVTPASYLIQVDIDEDGEADYEFATGSLTVGADLILFLYDDGAEGVFLMVLTADGEVMNLSPRT